MFGGLCVDLVIKGARYIIATVLFKATPGTLGRDRTEEVFGTVVCWDGRGGGNGGDQREEEIKSAKNKRGRVGG